MCRWFGPGSKNVTDVAVSQKFKPSDKKVLIIDDEESILQLLKSAFEVEGFQVKIGRDGRNIQKVSLEFQPDLIVSDLMMPGVGGYDVLRSLQGDPLTAKIPVIMMTGSQMNDSTKSVMQQEPNLVAYLEKPFRPETIIKKAHKVLNTMSAADVRANQSKDPPVDFNDVFR